MAKLLVIDEDRSQPMGKEVFKVPVHKITLPAAT